jgi:putative ABC transport system ATP-binding protein
MAVLHVEGLRFQRNGAAAADAAFAIEVDELRLNPGQVLGIVGPSGCGKSTLIDLLALLRRPTRLQRFELQGQDVAALWLRGAVDACTSLRAVHTGVVLQTGGLLPSLPLRENVLLPQRLLGRVDLAWADALLAALGLDALDRRLPSQLSIGQRQRVAIARALAHRPALVLADEPTASLGIEHAPAALDLLLSLARSSGAAIVIVSHDVELLRAKGVPLRRCAVHGDTVRLEAAA